VSDKTSKSSEPSSPSEREERRASFSAVEPSSGRRGGREWSGMLAGLLLGEAAVGRAGMAAVCGGLERSSRDSTDSGRLWG
jgi:hypothetical protein